ncbi:uncharacterized protein LOC135955553 [Calliphora vicina]|uniref:uncharacterized protein LOC135955553 n=1 Tax=Calliphora vicina TaxID=7373 RepID=UPI00325BF534
MPQLELCAAHILAKLYSKISFIFEKFNPEIFLWSDSTVVLLWLKKQSSTLTSFVVNRISDIQEETSNCTCRHVTTSNNPADILSRGCSVSELSSSIWFTGPAFLQEPSENWPNTVFPLNDDVVDSAIRKTVFKCQTNDNSILNFINRTSSYNKILRVICWLFRFRNKNKNNEISPEEHNRALISAVWIIQQNYFHEEFKILSKNKQLNNSLKSLSLFIQNVNGFPLIRVGGRLENADIPENRKHPFLLPKDCHFVNVIVRDTHVKNYHAVPKGLMAFIRQNFWIIGARNLIRKTVRSCPSCIRYRPKLLQQVMGDLPTVRVTPARPFERCGVDFCGPIYTYLKIRGKQPYKCYVAIFVCFVTKAVHIEAVSDLSSEAFIAALKRLIGRRGLPSTIFCDNATNFIGANAQLKDLKKLFMDKSFKNDITNFCSKNVINFNFIPPRAPHFGGIWEAAVKSAKGHLYRTLANSNMNYEELSTTLIEIEAIMNSRPISFQSNDPNDFEPLTPGHFLIGGPLNSLPEQNIECHDISNLQRWKRITAAKQQFWKKWSTDFLNEMIQKSRWSNSKTNIYRRPVHKLAILLNP